MNKKVGFKGERDLQKDGYRTVGKAPTEGIHSVGHRVATARKSQGKLERRATTERGCGGGELTRQDRVPQAVREAEGRVRAGGLSGVG